MKAASWNPGKVGVLLIVTLLAGCATPQHPAALKGQAFFAAGQWEEGIEQLEIAAKEEPRNFEHRSAIAEARMRAAADLNRRAAVLREGGRYSEAEAMYRRVLRIKPDESWALAGLQQTAAERRVDALLKEAEAAFTKKDYRRAEEGVRKVLIEAPNHARAKALMRQISERKPPAEKATALAAAMRKPVTLQFRDASLRMIFDALSRESGVNFVLDRDIPATAKASLFVRNTPLAEAVDSLVATNALEKKIVGDSQVLIYPNTPQKLREYRELIIRNFYLQSVEAKQMQTLLRTILKSQNIFIDERRNLLVMRDTPEAIRLAERLIAVHDQDEPEVMLEVEILEVTRARSREIGPKFPDAVTFGVADPITLRALQNIDSGGVNVTGLGSAARLNLKDLANNVNILANPRVRVRNKEKAKIHVGDRVPIISSTQSTITGVNSQAVSYLEVGIKLEVEPQVLDDGVMIKVGLEVSSLGKEVQVQGSIAYQVGTRNASTTLTLKDGETQVLGGLITDVERETTNRLPGIGDLPLVGRLFSSNKNDAEKTEILLSITPRIVKRLERPSAELAEYPSGPESHVQAAGAPVAGGVVPAPRPVSQPARGGFSGSAPRVPAPTPSPAPVPASPASGAPAPAGTTAPAAPPATPSGPLTPPPSFIFRPPPGVGQQ